jgi:isochorismate synthase
MPYSCEIVTGIQTSSKLHHFSGFDHLAEGFVVAPFDVQSCVEALFIQSDIHFINDAIGKEQLEQILSSSLETKETSTLSVDTTKENYFAQATSLIEKLNTKLYRKLVLSRTVTNHSCNKEQAAHIFEQLTQVYPHAFVSIFHIPGQAVWVGATPETLLKTNAEGIQTMSMAGTKAAISTLEWTDKEREEQQLVSDFVENTLAQFPFESIKKEGPLEQNAGNVCHLMTKYDCKGELSGKERYELIGKLHPTPAVCGIPTKEALQCIRQTERHDREYYAGYLGPANGSSCQLFINLRCMKLTTDEVTFFVGGGLTAQSEVEAEWNETCLKLETLSTIIQK